MQLTAGYLQFRALLLNVRTVFNEIGDPMEYYGLLSSEFSVLGIAVLSVPINRSILVFTFQRVRDIPSGLTHSNAQRVLTMIPNLLGPQFEYEPDLGFAYPSMLRNVLERLVEMLRGLNFRFSIVFDGETRTFVYSFQHVYPHLADMWHRILTIERTYPRRASRVVTLSEIYLWRLTSQLIIIATERFQSVITQQLRELMQYTSQQIITVYHAVVEQNHFRMPPFEVQVVDFWFNQTSEL